ncbi:MAG: hypothetical protein A3F78_20865 [Burkholderiales bacterium RIFCSPLOWO2_12_FULL_61_40]|nr:MAG: hypothetical protein A3F78_20865 [Burkholderiales bacterium RIFCSPLOWO2_12_FULL_61_40]
MHTLITYAAPPGPHCKAALPQLVLPNLGRLLRHLSPGARLQGQSTDLTPVHERVQAQAQGLEGADGLIPWAAQEAQRLDLTALHGPQGWAWVTPCHWTVQSDHVEMADPQHLALTPRDAETLYLAMQPYFAEDGITLFAHAQGQTHTRWLAHGAVFANLPTASLDRVAGHGVDAWLPRQPQAKPLRRLQNEMQMLLYTHPVNDQRATFHLSAVNAFWVSGTGTLHVPHGVPQPTTTCSVRDALRQPALADDAAAWTAAWHALDASTLAHDLERLQQGGPLQVTLCSDTQALTLEHRPLRPLQRLMRRIAPPQAQDFLRSL